MEGSIGGWGVFGGKLINITKWSYSGKIRFSLEIVWLQRGVKRLWAFVPPHARACAHTHTPAPIFNYIKPGHGREFPLFIQFYVGSSICLSPNVSSQEFSIHLKSHLPKKGFGAQERGHRRIADPEVMVKSPGVTVLSPGSETDCLLC